MVSWLSEHEALGSLRGTAGFWEPLQCLIVTGSQKLTDQRAARSELEDLFGSRVDDSYLASIGTLLFCWVEEHCENSGRDCLRSRFLGMV